MSPRPAEQAFTMIELMISMALSAIVLAMILGFVMNTMGSSDRSSARLKAQRAASGASEQLTADLRAMRAPQRQPKFTGSPDAVRSLLLLNENPRNLVVNDVLVATPTRLAFYAELINSSASSECVNWQVMPNGSMRRTVRSFTAGCGGGAILQDREVMPAPEKTVSNGGRASEDAKIPNPFAYLLLVQPVPNDPELDPSLCTRVDTPTASTILQRNQISAVQLDLRSFVANRNGHGDQRLTHAVSISSRQGIDYRYAIGCAA